MTFSRLIIEHIHRPTVAVSPQKRHTRVPDARSRKLEHRIECAANVASVTHRNKVATSVVLVQEFERFEPSPTDLMLTLGVQKFARTEPDRVELWSAGQTLRGSKISFDEVVAMLRVGKIQLARNVFSGRCRSTKG